MKESLFSVMCHSHAKALGAIERRADFQSGISTHTDPRHRLAVVAIAGGIRG